MGQQAMVELGEDEVEVVEVAESTAVREVGFSAASTSLGQEGAESTAFGEYAESRVRGSLDVWTLRPSASRGVSMYSMTQVQSR
jgi:hypothetical protein